MRVGVIGVGRIGQYHAKVLGEHPEVDSVVVADTSPGRAEAVARSLKLESAPSTDRLLEGVDAVVIAAPTNTHAELIRQAVDARLTTFCEKPIALDLESTRTIVRHVQDTGIVVQIGFQRRFDAGYRAARQAVTDGQLGTVYIARIAGHDPAPPHEAYIPASGGIFRDLHIHDFDIARFVLGQEVVEVYADGAVLAYDVFRKYDDVDTAVAILTFSGGTLGILSGTRHDPLGYDVRMELFGAGDSIAIGLDARTPLRSVEPGMPPAPRAPYEFFLDRFDAAYRAELDTFVNVVARRIPNPCPPEDAEAALRIAIACDRSRALHRPVRLDEVA
jgi:myo-inositol 2-dehydrogenase/D-chiro-inositol 1-dehydrogenase